MLRTALTLAFLSISAGSSRADTLPLVGFPAGYTPGVSFSFDINAPGLTGLTDYTLQFTVAAGTGTTPPDVVVTANPPAGLVGYPFPDTSNFFVESDPVSGTNSYNVTILDASSGSGINTMAGVNDHLATVTISPGVNLSGPITIQFTENDFDTSRDVGFSLPPTITIAELTASSPVPAPPAAVLLGIGGFCLAVRNRWYRGRSQSSE
jgi:hypothetical protein